MRGSALVGVLVCVVLCVVHAHPPTTFSMLLDGMNNPDATVNVPYNLTFVIYDMLNNNDLVNYSVLVPYHQRKMHVMLSSDDLQTVFHLHPEDFSTPQQMLQKNNFFVTVAFPKQGKWFIATSFMVNITGRLREGSAQYEFIVGAEQTVKPTFNYYNTNSFKTYPIGPDQVFNTGIDTTTNLVASSNGYTATVTFSPNQTTIKPYTCQPFYITVKGPNGQPFTNFVPYLDAPLHIIFAAEADTVYHGHGMDLPTIAPNLDAVIEYAKMDPHMGGMTTVQMAVMMNAMMIGINRKGVLNCTADLGQVMQQDGMSPYEEMLPSNYTFGPNFMGIFDFPNAGAWRMYLYFRVQEGSETKLIVPHFSLNSNNVTKPATTTTAGATTSSAGRIEVACWSVLLMAILTICKIAGL